MAVMTVAAAIIAYGQPESAAHLRTVFRAGGVAATIVSTSPGASEIADLALGNVGYGAAANAAFSGLGELPDWFVVSNDDLQLDSGAVESIRQRLSTLPPTTGMWSFSGCSDGIAPSRPPPHDAERSPHGALLAIRAPLFADLRGFDPRYFLYSEEVDLWTRLPSDVDSGWEVAAGVEHDGGGSSSDRLEAFHELGRSTAVLAGRHGWRGRAARRVVVRTLWVAVRRRQPRRAMAYAAGFLAGVLAPERVTRSQRALGAAPYDQRAVYRPQPTDDT